MQNLERFVPVIESSGVLPNPAGQARIACVDARDVAAVASAALTGEGHVGRRYSVTGPEALTHAEMAGHIGAASGRDVRCADVSPEAQREALLAGGMPEWHADVIAEFSSFFREGGAAAVSDVVETVTGRPARRFDSFAREAFSRVSSR
jgi:uncharacterized protein YbjT (DUF2867 family)